MWEALPFGSFTSHLQASVRGCLESWPIEARRQASNVVHYFKSAGRSVLKRVIIPQQQRSYLRWKWKWLPETLIGRMEPRKPQLSATCFNESTRVHTRRSYLCFSIWNHAGGFSMSICACLSLKMQPRND